MLNESRFVEIRVFTGYVPSLVFKFGSTYKKECDLSIDDHITERKKKAFKTEDIRRQMLSYPKLTAISCDPLVRDTLNHYSDTHPMRSTFIGECARIIFSETV